MPACLYLCTSPSSEGFKPDPPPFRVNVFVRGAIPALLAITGLQIAALKEQGLRTELTLWG